MSFLDGAALDIVWASGFWEGEGSCGVYNCGAKAAFGSLRISACQTDRGPIDKFFELFGGSITETPSKVGYKTIWTWSQSGTKAYYLLKLFLPWLKSEYRKGQVAEALNKWEVYRTKVGKTKHITKRTRARQSPVYEVRITTSNGLETVGSYRDPETAYLALLAAKRHDDTMDFYQGHLPEGET